MAKSDDSWSMASLDEDFVRGARIQERSAAERATEAKALKKADRKIRRRHHGRRALGLLVAVGVVGGIVALSTRQHPTDGLSFKVSPTTVVSTTSSNSLPVTTTTGIGTTTIVLNGGNYAVGQCVLWDQQINTKTRDVRTVSCETPHLYEIAGKTVVPPQWTDGPFPRDREAERMIDAACQGIAESYFGSPIDPSGFVEVTAISPSEKGWQAGDRGISCALTRGVIDRTDATKAAKSLDVETTGSLRTSDQRFPWKVGDCLTKETWTFRVPCDEPHMYEFVGWGLFPAQPAPPAVDDPAYYESCAALADVYQPDAPPSVAVWSMSIQPESWAAGSRSFACYLGASDKGPDGLPIKQVGSVRVVTV